jgi:hypothetical protein
MRTGGLKEKKKNVEIPLPLLKSLIELLDYWDVSLFERPISGDYWHALWALKLKLLKHDLRDAYARIANAPDDDSRHMARKEYLQLKSQLDSMVAGP